jgi:hypothetical protein
MANPKLIALDSTIKVYNLSDKFVSSWKNFEKKYEVIGEERVDIKKMIQPKLFLT